MSREDVRFKKTVYAYYRTHGRHSLPWRKTKNPYRIVVSEVMLQQTQVDRVIPKYQAFLRQFPTVRALADAPLGEVLKTWQGLGYNRRAQLLQRCAAVVAREHRGRWPREYAGLCALPGVGPYTAGAVLAFAFNTPIPIIETNIRAVYLHHYFPTDVAVPDSALMPIIARTLDTENPCDWYAALMDYGSHLKVTVGNTSRQSKHHTTQSAFVGSDRQIRGAVIKHLSNAHRPVAEATLVQALASFPAPRIRTQLSKLTTEGMVQQTKRGFSLPT